MAKFKEGSLFAIPLREGDWILGRVLLDMKRVVERKIVGPETALGRRDGLLLVEVYADVSGEPSDQVSEVLIPGAWVDPDALKGKEKPPWPVVGFRDVDPVKVDFPENVYNFSNVAKFEKGEIRQVVRGDSDDVGRWHSSGVFLLPGRFARVCSHYLGRKDDTVTNPNAFSLEREDLRFNPNRDEVMSKMDAPKGSTYFEWATQLGLDPGRLWA